MPMIFQLHQPYALNEKGRRSNNEDSVYPKKGFASDQDRAFLVCDGVGGQAKGEIASKIVSEIFGEALRQTRASESHYIEAVLQQVEDELQYYTQTHAESLGMATTLTMVHFHDNGVSVAHVGDSRIYQIRNGQIIYKSEDHSFVNELVRAGVITPDQASTHPQRNVITRAIQGNEKRTSSDVYVLQDVAPNDYFFLCTDGVLESVNDASLCQILTSPLSNEDKNEAILRLCEANSRDNFSCYLLQVENCQGAPDCVYEQPSFLNASASTIIPPTDTLPYQERPDEPATSFHPKYVPPQPEPEYAQPYHTPQNVYEDSPPQRPIEAIQSVAPKKSNSSTKWILGSFFFMAFAGGGTWYFLQQNNKIIPLQPTIETVPATITEPIPTPVAVDSPIVNPTELMPIPVVKENPKPSKEQPKKETVKKNNEEKKAESKPVIKPELPLKEVKKEVKPEDIKEIKEIKKEENKEPNLQNDEKDEPLGNETKQGKTDNTSGKTITNKTSQAIQKKDNKK
jgi:serine/threonine protein phosphatase PrpC